MRTCSSGSATTTSAPAPIRGWTSAAAVAIRCSSRAATAAISPTVAERTGRAAIAAQPTDLAVRTGAMSPIAATTGPVAAPRSGRRSARPAAARGATPPSATFNRAGGRTTKPRPGRRARAGPRGGARRGPAAVAGGGGGGGGGGRARGGGGGGFRGGGGGRRSDIALKHDIALLGHLGNGLGFYRFAYNGSHTDYVGVMAQEVQAVMPQAVTRGRDGYLRVFYDKLGVTFETYDAWVAAGAHVPAGVPVH